MSLSETSSDGDVFVAKFKTKAWFLVMRWRDYEKIRVVFLELTGDIYVPFCVSRIV